MIEYWEKAEVVGTGGDGENQYTVREEIMHLREQDPLMMACRRNRKMAGCHRFYVENESAFVQVRGDPEGRRLKRTIPRDERKFEALDW